MTKTTSRGYKVKLASGQKLSAEVTDRGWTVKVMGLNGDDWKPAVHASIPIWEDSRKWEDLPKTLSIDSGEWRKFRASVEEQEAEIKNIKEDAEEEFPPEIIEKAKHILEKEDPITFFLDVFNKIHIGDRELGYIMLCCLGSQHCKNSQGLHPKLSGDSGMGKSDAVETFLHLLPKNAYLRTSLSSKAIFYHKINPGTIIFLDDYKQNDDLDAIIKQTSSNFHEAYEHRTIDKDREAKTLLAPPEIVWTITSVDSSQDLQVLNRQVGLDVDNSAAATQKVIKHLFEKAAEGEERFPVTDEVLTCRTIISEIKNQNLRVSIPFAGRMNWKDESSRRNPSIFLDVLKSIALIRFKQRNIKDDIIFAEEADFDDAKALYLGRAETLIDKLTRAERRLVEAIVDNNGEIYREEAADKIGCSVGRISQLVHGEGGKSGLLGKLPSFNAEIVIVKDEVRNISKLLLTYSKYRTYDRFQTYGDIVTLSPPDGEMKREPNDPNTELTPKTDRPRKGVSKVSINRSIIERDITDSETQINSFSHTFPKKPNYPNTEEADSEKRANTVANTERKLGKIDRPTPKTKANTIKAWLCVSCGELLTRNEVRMVDDMDYCEKCEPKVED